MFYRDLPYFAYGSNLNLGQMQIRCKFARDIGAATLDDYELIFNGVADIRPASGRKVLGGLWQITNRCLEALDRYEGFPHLYRRELITVLDEAGEYVPAFVYVMNGDHHRSRVSMPSQFYFDCIREGYKDFGLPERLLWEAYDQTQEEVKKREIARRQQLAFQLT